MLPAYDSQTIHLAYEKSLKILPEIYRYLNFKNYDPYRGNEYLSNDFWKLNLAATVEKNAKGYFGTADLVEYIYAIQSKKYLHPMYWVDKELASHLKKTKLPTEINWIEMELPLPVCTFILPKNLFVTPSQKIVHFISYCRVFPNEDIPYYSVKDKVFAIDRPNFIVYAGLNSGEILHFAFTNESGGYKLDLSNLHEHMDGTGLKEHFSAHFPIEVDEEDKETLKKVVHLAFVLILLMKDRPTIVEKAVLKKRIKSKASTEIKEFWTSPIIGKDYKIKIKYESKGGTHAAPRLHYVRGFFNTFYYGVGKKEKKDQWVEPYWRGGNE